MERLRGTSSALGDPGKPRHAQLTPIDARTASLWSPSRVVGKLFLILKWSRWQAAKSKRSPFARSRDQSGISGASDLERKRAPGDYGTWIPKQGCNCRCLWTYFTFRMLFYGRMRRVFAPCRLRCVPEEMRDYQDVSSFGRIVCFEYVKWL